MFLLQLRPIFKAQTRFQSLQQLKNAVLNSIRSQYELEFDWDGFGPSAIYYDEKFYYNYFDFATYCRMNGKVIDWSGCYREQSFSLLKVRSALAFLEEDIISRDLELSNSIDWRILKNEGIRFVDEAVVCHARFKMDYGTVDLRAVPYRHNWWNHGEFTFKDSEERFGEAIEKGNTDPILPIMEVLEREDTPINVQNSDWVSILPKGYMYLIEGMFQRHLKMRSLSIHPVSTFDYYGVSEDEFLLTLSHLDTLVSYACEHPEEISPLVVRSAIEFYEEDLVPFISGADPIWHKFLTGNGMKRLNELLLQKQWNVPTKYDDLESVPSNHNWWPERYRKIPSEPLHISVAFGEHRERILCYLQKLAESSGKRTTIKNFNAFNMHYFNYGRMCSKYKQVSAEMLGEEGLKEFRENFHRALDRLSTTRLNYWTMNIYSLRCLRSTLEFLKEQEKDNEEFQKMFGGDALKKLDKALEKREPEASQFPEFLPGNKFQMTLRDSRKEELSISLFFKVKFLHPSPPIISAIIWAIRRLGLLETAAHCHLPPPPPSPTDISAGSITVDSEVAEDGSPGGGSKLPNLPQKMSSAPRPLKRPLLSFLECSICFEAYDLNDRFPLIGNCGHTICFACRTRMSSKCPICQKKNAFVYEVKNFSLIQMIEEKMDENKRQKRDPGCSLCQTPVDVADSHVCLECVQKKSCKTFDDLIKGINSSKMCRRCAEAIQNHGGHDTHNLCDAKSGLQSMYLMLTIESSSKLMLPRLERFQTACEAFTDKYKEFYKTCMTNGRMVGSDSDFTALLKTIANDVNRFYDAVGTNTLNLWKLAKECQEASKVVKKKKEQRKGREFTTAEDNTFRALVAPTRAKQASEDDPNVTVEDRKELTLEEKKAKA